MTHASEPYLIVSSVRTDGGAHSTTFMGYSAEALAFRYMNDLEQSAYTLFASVVQRIRPDNGRDPMEWDTRRQYVRTVNGKDT